MGTFDRPGIGRNGNDGHTRLERRNHRNDRVKVGSRIDGDTGALAGTYKDGKFVVSHFAGSRPMVLELTPLKDGSLEINRNRVEKMVGIKASEAEARNLPKPTDPSRHSSVKDPTAKFTWSFPGMDGKPIASDDPRFRGKVVVVSIGGSWCPNCHDEAPFLVELYKEMEFKQWLAELLEGRPADLLLCNILAPVIEALCPAFHTVLSDGGLGERYSNGWGAAAHVPTILIENHSLKPHEQRVLGTYVFIEEAMRLLADQGREADAWTLLNDAIAAVFSADRNSERRTWVGRSSRLTICPRGSFTSRMFEGMSSAG